YPGTKLAFTEWSYGGGGDISGALAAADVLGIFGCHGVALATNWPTSKSEEFMLAAIRAYRNFDGHSGRFGDTAVYAKTSNFVSSSVYASVDSKNSRRVTAIAINKLPASQTAGLRIWS